MSGENPFNIFSEDKPVSGREFSAVKGAPKNVVDRIETIINSSGVVLFMKGNANAPQCGFSANSTEILNSLGVEYTTYDILMDPELRQGLKEYSNWPTYPQLYIKGKFLGGNDILTEMYESGELKKYIES